HMETAGSLSITLLTGSNGFEGEYYTYAIIGGITLPLILLIIDPKIGFKLSNITVPIMLAFTIYMLIKLLSADNLASLNSFEATKETNWIFGLEAIFAYAVVWLLYIVVWNIMAISV